MANKNDNQQKAKKNEPKSGNPKEKGLNDNNSSNDKNKKSSNKPNEQVTTDNLEKNSDNKIEKHVKDLKNKINNENVRINPQTNGTTKPVAKAKQIVKKGKNANDFMIIGKSKYWNEQYARWYECDYEIINLNSLLRDHNGIDHEYYNGLSEKIIQSNFKNIITVADVLRQQNYDLEKISQSEIINDLGLHIKDITIHYVFGDFKVRREDLIWSIENNDYEDIQCGNIIIVIKKYYADIVIKKDDLKERSKKKIKEFRKVKYIMGGIGITIVIVLIVLTIFSGNISEFIGGIDGWFKSITGKAIKLEYAIFLAKFMEFIIKLIVVYVIYRVLVWIFRVVFHAVRKTSLRSEMMRISREKTDLHERLEQYRVIAQSIVKKTESGMKGIKFFLKIILFIFILMTILSLFNISLTSLFASATILTLIVTIGAQTLLSDYFAGFMFAFEDHYNLGDMVLINGVRGKIISANLRRICIETFDKQRHFILHSQIKHVVNFSKDNNKARIEFDIAYEANAKQVVHSLKTFLARIWRENKSIKDEPIVYALTAFNASGVGIMILAECEKETMWGVERWLRLEIFHFCQEQNIEIPYQKIVISK